MFRSYQPRHVRPPGPGRTRVLVVGLALAALSALSVGTAAADPDFGPGSSSKGPQDPGAKCHPPGQVLPTPECKE